MYRRTSGQLDTSRHPCRSHGRASTASTRSLLLNLQESKHRKLKAILDLEEQSTKTEKVQSAGQDNIKTTLDMPPPIEVDYLSEIAQAKGAFRVAAVQHQRRKNAFEREFNTALKNNGLKDSKHLKRALTELEASITELNTQLEAEISLRDQPTAAPPPLSTPVDIGRQASPPGKKPKVRRGSKGREARPTGGMKDDVEDKGREETDGRRKIRKWKRQHAYKRRLESGDYQRVMHDAPKGRFRRFLDKLATLMSRSG